MRAGLGAIEAKKVLISAAAVGENNVVSRSVEKYQKPTRRSLEAGTRRPWRHHRRAGRIDTRLS